MREDISTTLKLARGGGAALPSPSSRASSRGIKCQHSLPLAACVRTSQSRDGGNPSNPPAYAVIDVRRKLTCAIRPPAEDSPLGRSTSLGALGTLESNPCSAPRDTPSPPVMSAG
jgi:hypothetical protein